MSISSKTLIYAVIGNPIIHSQSPELHNKWVKDHDLDMIYLPLKVEDIDSFMLWVKKSNIKGFNVTIPHKEAVITYLDEIDDRAKVIGAVNTIEIKDDRMVGYNTDIDGIDISLKDHLTEKSQVLVIGAGGAARAVCSYLQSKKIKMTIKNRTLEKSHQFANEFGCDLYTHDSNSSFDIIINTTPIGMKSKERPIDLTKLNRKPNFVFDLIYQPSETPLLNQAKELGIQYLNGMPMLIEQAKKAFQIWTGIYPK